MTFSYKDMARHYGVSRATFTRHLKKIITNGLFKKTAAGDCFNEVDAFKIAHLLGFEIKNLQTITRENQQKKEITPPNQINLIESIKEVEKAEKNNRYKFR